MDAGMPAGRRLAGKRPWRRVIVATTPYREWVQPALRRWITPSASSTSPK